MKRLALALVLAFTACGDPSTTSTPAEPSTTDSAEMAAMALRMTLSPSLAHFAKSQGVGFEVVIQRGNDTLDVPLDSVEFLVTDTAVVRVDPKTAVVWGRKGGYAVLVAKWKSIVAASALIVEDVNVRYPGNVRGRNNPTMTQGAASSSDVDFIPGRPVFVQYLVAADTANDWYPVAIVAERGDGEKKRDTLPMDAPDGGLPVGLQRDDEYEPIDSTFRAIIPADSVRLRNDTVKWGYFDVTVDWNTRDGRWQGGVGYGQHSS